MEDQPKDKMEYGFAPHLMLNCFGCSQEKLSDVALITQTLASFPEKIGTSRVIDPQVFKYEGADLSDSGISGVVLIAEGHITIHTSPAKRHAFIDIFSSKDFDASSAVAYMVGIFEAASHEAELSNRGLEFPKHARRATDTIEREQGVSASEPRLYN
jgi:S-adenosylmethionine decarboxylase